MHWPTPRTKACCYCSTEGYPASGHSTFPTPANNSHRHVPLCARETRRKWVTDIPHAICHRAVECDQCCITLAPDAGELGFVSVRGTGSHGSLGHRIMAVDCKRGNSDLLATAVSQPLQLKNVSNQIVSAATGALGRPYILVYCTNLARVRVVSTKYCVFCQRRRRRLAWCLRRGPRRWP